MPSPGRIATIILHYRGVDDTLRCLQSLVPEKDDNHDILLIENGSADPIASLVSSRFPEVVVVQLAENRGWAGGNNAGIELARERGAQFVCFLNNDTILPPQAIMNLTSCAAQFGPCLLHPAIDYLNPDEGAQLDPTQESRTAPLPGWDTVYPLDHAYGACLMMPMSVLDRVGLFDERFFLQLEETDFYERANKLNIPAICNVSVRIYHAESRTFGAKRTPLKTYYIIRNGLLLAEKQKANLRRYFSLLRKVYWGVDYAYGFARPRTRFGIYAWIVSNDPHACAARRGVRDYVTRRFGRAPADIEALMVS